MSSIHADARAAAGFNSREDDGETEGVAQPMPAAVFNRTMVEMANIERDKRALAERERDVKKEFVNNGGSKQALGFIRKLDKMDPDEREALLHEIDRYAAFQRYW